MMPDRKTINELMERAKSCALKSYSPYSGFRVGCAVLTEKGVYTGANIENMSYGLSLCAERVAISSCIMDSCEAIQFIAIYCDIELVDTTKKDVRSLCSPCGACRQWFVEHAADAHVITNGWDTPIHVPDLMLNAFELSPKA